jgi:thiol-disulfide isomerase/thioredoxin
MKTRTLVLVCGAALALSMSGAVLLAQDKHITAVATAPAATAEKPTVKEIKEPELKLLLQEGAEKKRPLLINFWATWCTPCREEFPDLVKIREKYSDDALQFITISLDDPSEIGTSVPGFLADMRAGRMPAYLLNATDADTAVLIVDKNWQGQLPATFLFDQTGKLSFSHMGRVKTAELTAAIERTLQTK